jgi:hypothetical protein
VRKQYLGESGSRATSPTALQMPTITPLNSATSPKTQSASDIWITHTFTPPQVGNSTDHPRPLCGQMRRQVPGAEARLLVGPSMSGLKSGPISEAKAYSQREGHVSSEGRSCSVLPHGVRFGKFRSMRYPMTMAATLVCHSAAQRRNLLLDTAEELRA